MVSVADPGFYNFCISWGRIRIRIWIGIKIECRIWIQIGIKTMPVTEDRRPTITMRIRSMPKWSAFRIHKVLMLVLHLDLNYFCRHSNKSHKIFLLYNCRIRQGKYICALLGSESGNNKQISNLQWCLWYLRHVNMWYRCLSHRKILWYRPDLLGSVLSIHSRI